MNTFVCISLADQVVGEPDTSAGILAEVKLEKGTFTFGQQLDAGLSGAAASAFPMDTAASPESTVGASAIAEGLSFIPSQETGPDQLKNSEIVGASSFSLQTGGGHGTSESSIAFNPIVSPNLDTLRHDKKTMVQVADNVQKRSDSGVKKPFEKRGKRKFEDIEDNSEDHQTQYSIVAEQCSSMATKTAENAKRDYQSSTLRSGVQKVMQKKDEKKTEKKSVHIKSTSQIEAESNKVNNKTVWDAERREYERKIASYKLSNLTEVKYQQYLASQASTTAKANETVKKNKVMEGNRKGNTKNDYKEAENKNEKMYTANLKQETGTEIIQKGSEGMEVTLAAQLRAECHKLNNVRAASEAETRYWEKNQDNSHGKTNTRSTSKDKNIEVQKEVKKVRVANEQKQLKEGDKNVKAIMRKRATKSMSEDSEYQKKDELRKMRATSSMSDIQDNYDVKLTYAGMVIKGEQDRRARFEVTLAGYLSAEYKNIAKLQSALMCEVVYQRSLVSKNDFPAEKIVKNVNIDMNENVKKSQMKRQKSRSNSKEKEMPKKQDDTIKKEVVKEVNSSRQVKKSSKEVKRNHSQDQECQTDRKPNEERCAEMVALPTEEDLQKDSRY